MALCLLLGLPWTGRGDDNGRTNEPPRRDPAQTTEDDRFMQGALGGIGAQLKEAKGVLVVDRVVPGTPAERAGVPAGADLIAINGISTAGMKLDDAVKLIRGPAGTQVVVAVRNAAGAVVEFTLTREKIVVALLDKPHASLCAPTVGLVKLFTFNPEAGNEVRQAIGGLQAQGAKALILDLRACGGSSLRGMRDAASLFLPKDAGLWLVEDAESGERTMTKAAGTGEFAALPLVVLVSGETIAELFPGAIKRNQRGPLIGQKTSGQVLLQRQVKDPDGSSRLVTTGTFLLSAKEPISGVGVAPDIEVPAGTADAEYLRLAQEALAKLRSAVPPGSPSTKLPMDLVAAADPTFASVQGLAAGSQEAQTAQKAAVAKLGLPLEVTTVKTGISFRLIPAGSFTMGSPKAERDALKAAGVPRDWLAVEVRHPVTLTKAYYCGKYPVTQGQWEAVMGDNPSRFKNAGKDAPVEQVSWDDCQAFLTKLCALEGVPADTYRLLTEAEWEYACRAGTSTALYNGDITIKGERNAPALDPLAWYGGNSGVAYEGGIDSSKASGKQYDHQRSGTHPVGQKLPNAYGLYDMLGNVWQWCGDWYGDYGAGAVTDPAGPALGSVRVARGGSWSDRASFSRAAGRGKNSPSDRGCYQGFRILRVAPAL